MLTPNSNAISLANVERVEVLKGPSGTLFGRSAPGGLINVITKKPQRESYYSLQQQFGSYDTFRTLADATGSLNDDGTVLYRLNYEHLNSRSFRDFFQDNRDFVAPSLTWLISDRTKLDLNFLYQERSSPADSGIPLDLQQTGVIPGRIPRNFRGNEPTDFTRSRYYEGDITLTHEFNENWNIRTRFSTINTFTASAQTSSNANADLVGDLNRVFLKNAVDLESEYGTADVTGHVATGDFKHTLLFGTDYYRAIQGTATSQVRSGAAVPTINVFNPVYGFTTFLNDPLGPFNNVRNEWYGVYAQDQVAWHNWQLLFGSRFDHAEFQTASARRDVNIFSPKVGLLYHPLPWLGVFGDYVTTFNAVNQGTTITGALPDPEKSQEFEFGVKGEWLDGRLTANLAYYELTKTNVQTPLPAPFANRVGITGEQVSRGVEFDLSGQLTDYWNVIASYAYTRTEVTRDSAPLDTFIGSSGPGNSGNRFANVPLHSGSFWTTYDFSGLGVPGFSAGSGVYLVDDRAGNINNSFYLPGYIRLDALLKYQQKVGKSNVTLQLNVENLLDAEYFVASNGFASFIHQTLPGAPRTFLGSVKVEF